MYKTNESARTFFSSMCINACVTLFSIFFALLLSEVIIRAYMPHPDYGSGIRPAFYSNMFEYDPLLGWRGVKNLHTPYFSKDFKITVDHDADGKRSLLPGFSEGKDNLLLLGDSYGWGWGVENYQTAASFLAQKDPSMNLYNLSVAGYGTDQELLSLKKFLADNPEGQYKGVFLLFYMNDFDDISSSQRYGYPKPVFNLQDNQLILTNTPVPFKRVPQDMPITEDTRQSNIFMRSQLYNMLMENAFLPLIIFLNNEIDREVVASAEENLSSAPPGSKELALHLLSEIKKVCDEKNMFFHVVFLVTMDTQRSNINDIHALASNLPEFNVEYSFLSSKRFPSTDLWLDAHYSPYGQKLLSDHIHEIAESKLQKK